jgi:hypothetical protein
VRVGDPDFAEAESSFLQARALIRRVEAAQWALELHRASQPRSSDVDFTRRVISALDPAHE